MEVNRSTSLLESDVKISISENQLTLSAGQAFKNSRKNLKGKSKRKKERQYHKVDVTKLAAAFEL
jgi:HSP20 family molecular chaperone IbpA